MKDAEYFNTIANLHVQTRTSPAQKAPSLRLHQHRLLIWRQRLGPYPHQIFRQQELMQFLPMPWGTQNCHVTFGFRLPDQI